MGLSDALLAMVWDDIERNGAWNCEGDAIRDALVRYSGV